MRSALSLFLIALLSLTGCRKSSSSPSVTASNSGTAASIATVSPAGDPLDKKLQELSGGGATNCGRLKSQAPEQMDTAAKCAMQAAKEKHAFYIAYELPGMMIAVAGNADGKLFTVQSESMRAPGSTAGLASGSCPSDLRVAPSGRVTCFAPGTFGMGMDATHGRMMKAPAMGANPHKGLGIPPPGQANPHQPQAPPAKHP